jgi:hypothetical protein
MSNSGLLSSFNPARTTRKYSNLDKDLQLSLNDMGTSVGIDVANNYSVILPDCRQLKEKVAISIFNMSTSTINLLNNDSGAVKSLSSKQSTSASCTNKSTAAGTWVFT